MANHLDNKRRLGHRFFHQAISDFPSPVGAAFAVATASVFGGAIDTGTRSPEGRSPSKRV
jgi:hypothetical protein